MCSATEAIVTYHKTLKTQRKTRREMFRDAVQPYQILHVLVVVCSYSWASAWRNVADKITSLNMGFLCFS